ncbi:MAG: cell division protein FtsZ [Chthoniobacteraceae bacterium]
MIELNRNYNLGQTARESVIIKIVGIGGAGSNALDRIVLDGIESAEIVAINTDVQSLTSSVATQKVQLGRSATRGLGAGGDPEVGLAAAEEAAEEIRQALEGVEMIFICVGLGGGTGSGSAPLIASIAKEHGALTVVIATMPFAFEGRRRTAQAEEALAALQEAADAVICFENDKMGDAVSPHAGVHQAFAAADQTISQSVRAIYELFTRPGIISIGFDDLVTALRSKNARCLFGYGEAGGDNRSHESLELALKNPLMNRGRMLAETHNLLVNVVGGTSMTLNEVQILMEELGRHVSDDTRILFGTAVDPKLGDNMCVTLISSVAAEDASNGKEQPVRTNYVRPARTEVEVKALPVAAVEKNSKSKRVPEKIEARDEKPLIENEVPEEKVEAEIEPVVAHPKPAPIKPLPVKPMQPETAPPVVAKAQQERQESLAFEPLNRGRFEKSEPTIVNGQDLDVPTFMRRNIKIK